MHKLELKLLVRQQKLFSLGEGAPHPDLRFRGLLSP